MPLVEGCHGHGILPHAKCDIGISKSRRTPGLSCGAQSLLNQAIIISNAGTCSAPRFRALKQAHPKLNYVRMLCRGCMFGRGSARLGREDGVCARINEQGQGEGEGKSVGGPGRRRSIGHGWGRAEMGGVGYSDGFDQCSCVLANQLKHRICELAKMEVREKQASASSI